MIESTRTHRQWMAAAQTRGERAPRVLLCHSAGATRFGALARCAMAVIVLSATSALASTAWQAYEKKQFDAALTRGDGFVLALVTDWCTTCSLQEAVVSDLLSEPRFASLSVLVADFDRELELRQRLRVTMRGTFIVFKQGREVTRSTGLTDRAEIAALLARAL